VAYFLRMIFRELSQLSASRLDSSDNNEELTTPNVKEKVRNYIFHVFNIVENERSH